MKIKACGRFELLPLTASRSGEVLKATWSEFDLDNRLWTIAGERMKAGKEHQVPLPDAVLAVPEKRAKLRGNDNVFAGRGTGPAGKNTLGAVLKRLGL